MKNVEISNSIKNYEYYLKNDFIKFCTFCDSMNLKEITIEYSVSDNLLLLFRYCEDCKIQMDNPENYILIHSFETIPSLPDFYNQFEKTLSSFKKTILLI